jgi:hypothetical protein
MLLNFSNKSVGAMFCSEPQFVLTRLCSFVTVETYLSPVETHCNNIDYYLPDVDNVTKQFSDDAMARLRE